MHINVQHILAEELGHNQTFTVTDERPAFDQVTLTVPLSGEIKIARLDDGIVVTGRIWCEIELECHRCLRSFVRPVSVRFEQLFIEQLTDDGMLIDPEGSIDLMPLLQQEILLSLPIKLLCRDDCLGLDDVASGATDEPDHSLGTTARITKGP